MEEVMNELDTLKARADMLGIKYHPNIKLESLRHKVNAKLEGVIVVDEEEEMEEVKPMNKMAVRKEARDKALKLVRIRLSCMDPAKNQLQGEIITVSNNVVGDVKKYIPYNTDFYENGYHVPNIIYKYLLNRKYSSFREVKTAHGPVIQSSLANAYSIEVLPQLTEKELQALARQQAAAKAMD